MKKLYWTLVAAFAVDLAFAAGPAIAQTTVCTGTLAPGTYVNVGVPEYQTCTIPSPVLVPMIVTGNVHVAAGAKLLIEPGVLIVGNVQSTDAAVVALGSAATIGGNVVLNGTTEQASVFEMTIGGNVIISNSPSGAFQIYNSNVTGNVFMVNNTQTLIFPGQTGPLVAANTIGGNLLCGGNTPPPNDDDPGGTAFPNAAVHKLGQCAGL